MSLQATPAAQLQPTATKQAVQTNYVDVFDYTSYAAPETHDEMAAIYGNQSIAGMLYEFSSEDSFASDKYIWTEEGRRHTVYTDVARASNVFTKAGHNFRVGETVEVSDATAKRRGRVTAVTASTFTLAAYKAAGFAALGTTNLVAFVDGTEFPKGSDAMEGSLVKDFTVLSNKPIILRDNFEKNGSDVTQISWIKTAEGGYLWYPNDQMDTRARWEDRLELAMLQGENAEAGSDASNAGFEGTEGLIEASRTRGNLFQGSPSAISDWDTVVKRFDAQGKIADYFYFVDRDLSLDTDDMLGALNAGYSGGLSFGIFDNDENMALNLGFRGFKRGTYNVFKNDAKALNDPTLFGAQNVAVKVRGFLIPVGTDEVYEGEYNGRGTGSKISTPFLTQMYRVAGAENRRYKTWVTGSVFGVRTNGKDVMQEHHLSERFLKVCGANNFMLFEGN